MFNFPLDLFGMSNNNRRMNNNNLNAHALLPQSLFANGLMFPPVFSGINPLMGSFSMVHNSTVPMHSFSSTTVMSYNGADGRPKVYQETTSRNRGPGGMEETRQAIRDTERGINKVQIGHRIGDRKHVIEREMNVQTGQISENIELENLDETETDDFKKEWRQRTAQVGVHHPRPSSSSMNSNHLYSSSSSRPQLAIEHHSSRRKPSKTTTRVQPSDTIDLTGDDFEEIPRSSTTGKRKSSHDESTSRKRRHE